MSRRTRVITVAVAVLLVLGCVLGWWLLRDDEDGPVMASEPAVTATATPTIPAPSVEPVRGPCTRAADLPFTPETISIEGVVAEAAVVPVPRDSRGVTGVLPESNTVDFAWDQGGIRPGSPRGNVLLNTHTWPDGTALGNALLDGFDKGDQVVVEGLADARLCYRVTQRIEVPASEGYPPYYEEHGPHRLAFIVCSGERTGPGQWSHRTIWFARPVA